eukprot:scaffold1074_cov192-Pinguiococcus_pyrenoidosus.AAC.4
MHRLCSTRGTSRAVVGALYLWKVLRAAVDLRVVESQVFQNDTVLASTAMAEEIPPRQRSSDVLYLGCVGVPLQQRLDLVSLGFVAAVELTSDVEEEVAPPRGRVHVVARAHDRSSELAEALLPEDLHRDAPVLSDAGVAHVMRGRKDDHAKNEVLREVTAESQTRRG